MIRRTGRVIGQDEVWFACFIQTGDKWYGFGNNALLPYQNTVRIQQDNRVPSDHFVSRDSRYCHFNSFPAVPGAQSFLFIMKEQNPKDPAIHFISIE
jgi:hypothetical protein